jgi:hypothetical protein
LAATTFSADRSLAKTERLSKRRFGCVERYTCGAFSARCPANPGSRSYSLPSTSTLRKPASATPSSSRSDSGPIVDVEADAGGEREARQRVASLRRAERRRAVRPGRGDGVHDGDCPRLLVQREVRRELLAGDRIRLEADQPAGQAGREQRGRSDPRPEVDEGRARPQPAGEGGDGLGLPVVALEPVPEGGIARCVPDAELAAALADDAALGH